jgi:acetyl-CoA carboxylase carboxyltransferase component
MAVHGDTIRDRAEGLKRRKQALEGMGGAEAVSKQHEAGKLTARERVKLLFDEGTFQENGILATHQSNSPDMAGKITPADGVITGIGKIYGRPVCVVAYDYTVMAGTMGEVGERKVTRMREWALNQRLPIVWLLDSAGARVQEAAGAHFAGTGKLFFDQVMLSGVVPQVAAIMGPTAAGTAYIPALADFVPMVKGISSMALAGPPLVKAAINEDVTTEELGGSSVHCKVSGVADLETRDDHECISVIRHYLFPSHSGLKPKRKAMHQGAETAPVGGKFARKSLTTEKFDPLAVDEKILSILPEDPRRAYDMREVIHAIVDPASEPRARSSFLEIKPDFARNMIVGLARIDGWSIGIVANQPSHMGGAIDIDASDKAARHIQLCDAFNIPVLFLHDCPGFMVGSRMEKLGIIRHGAKMLFAVSEMTVPKFSVVVRRSYGAGYYVMCGKGYEPDLLVGWPTSEVSLMSPEGAVNIVFRKEIAAAADPEAARATRVEQYRSMIGGQISAAQGHLDDIIDPRDTRRVLARALENTRKKSPVRPKKKHGVNPV